MKKNNYFLIIFLIVFIDLMGFGIILPLLPFIAEKYQANSFVIGLISATYSFFQIISAPILGILSDRFGRKKLLMISQIGTFLGFLILFFANSIPLIFISRIIDGITGGNISIAQAYISDITDKKNRARGMGLIGAAFGLGFIFGPIIGGILSKISFSAPALAALLVSLLTIILTFFLLEETIKLNKKTQNQRYLKKSLIKEINKIFKNKNLMIIFLTFFIVNLSFSLYQTMISLYSEKKFNFGPSENGIILSYIGILVVIVQLKIMPFFIRVFKEKKLMILGIFFLFFGFLLSGFSINLFFLFISLTIIPFGSGFFNPSIQALASEMSLKEETGEIMGILQSFGALGRILGPILGGYLFLYSIYLPFYFASFIVFFAFLFNKFFLKKTNND